MCRSTFRNAFFSGSILRDADFRGSVLESADLRGCDMSNADIRGIYPLINQEFCIHAWEGATYINREEDMGVEGLRKAKESYRPCHMVEKYVIEIK